MSGVFSFGGETANVYAVRLPVANVVNEKARSMGAYVLASPISNFLVEGLAAVIFNSSFPKMYFPDPAPETVALLSSIKEWVLVVILPSVKVNIPFIV